MQRGEGVAALALSNLNIDPYEARREVVGMLGGGRVGGPVYGYYDELYRVRVVGIEVKANVGAGWEEQRSAQTLVLSLDYTYVAKSVEGLSWIDHEDLIENAVEALKQRGAQLLEAGIKHVGERVLGEYPNVMEITVEITVPKASRSRPSKVSVSATFRQ